jgi:hypothetical protein
MTELVGLTQNYEKINGTPNKPMYVKEEIKELR